MERKVEIKKINVDEVINFFEKEDGIELTRQEAEEIAHFITLLVIITIKRFCK